MVSIVANNVSRLGLRKIKKACNRETI